ncbi:MAG: YceI family protein [Cyclobacteriaceae bacterium]
MKSLKLSGLILSAALLTFGCGKSTETVETAEEMEVAQAAGDTLSLDVDASKVNWRGYKPTGQHFGIIPVTDGFLTLEDSEIKAGNFTIDITQLEIHDMEEGSENHGKLWNHLQSDDFFDAANHPQATFEITSISTFSATDSVENKEQFESENTPKSSTEIAPDAPTHWISGNLTMRGQTKNIKFPANVSINNGTVDAKAGFNIDRTEWGLSYGDEATAVDKTKDQFIYNTVSVNFDIQAD